MASGRRSLWRLRARTPPQLERDRIRRSLAPARPIPLRLRRAKRGLRGRARGRDRDAVRRAGCTSAGDPSAALGGGVATARGGRARRDRRPHRHPPGAIGPFGAGSTARGQAKQGRARGVARPSGAAVRISLRTAESLHGRDGEGRSRGRLRAGLLDLTGVRAPTYEPVRAAPLHGPRLGRRRVREGARRLGREAKPGCAC